MTLYDHPRTPARPDAALITGATSGIGFAMARELSQRGHDVLVVADRGVDAAVRMLAEHTDATVTGLEVDLTQPAGVEEAAARARELGVRMFVLNAGVGVHGPFLRTALEDELRLVDLNVRSVVHLAHLVLPDLVAGRRGRLLVTSSTASAMPAPLFSTYAASKAFLRSFAWSLRGELIDTGVTVTALLPSATSTPFFRQAKMEGTHIGRAPKATPALVARRAVDALLAGRAEVVPGLQAKLMMAMAAVLPQPARTAVHGWLYEPGAAPFPASDDGPEGQRASRSTTAP